MTSLANRISAAVPDIVERVAWTFVQAGAAVWLAPVVGDVLNGDGTLVGVWAELADTDVLQKAAIAGLAAVLALLKATYGLTIGNKATASTLPAELDPATK